jgi:hypothetical protein
MEMAIGIALLVVFLAVVVLIVRGQSPVVMLLVLAVAWEALAGIGIDGVQAKVLQGGGVVCIRGNHHCFWRLVCANLDSRPASRKA